MHIYVFRIPCGGPSHHQEALDLKISQRISQEWIGRQWASWCDFGTTLGLPDSLFIRSEKSTTAKGSAGVRVDGMALREFGMTTPALLASLSRMGATMNNEQKARARQLLEDLIRLLPAGSAHVRKNQSTTPGFPPSVNEQTAQISIDEHGKVLLTDFIDVCPAITKLQRRPRSQTATPHHRPTPRGISFNNLFLKIF